VPAPPERITGTMGVIEVPRAKTCHFTAAREIAHGNAPALHCAFPALRCGAKAMAREGKAGRLARVSLRRPRLHGEAKQNILRSRFARAGTARTFRWRATKRPRDAGAIGASRSSFPTPAGGIRSRTATHVRPIR